jgi:hypothetical protein
MGTGKAYEAPTSPPWRTAKRRFRRFAAQGGTAGGGVEGVVRAYVRAHGGATGAATSAVAGKRTLRRLGSFFGDVARLGFEEALRENGLDDLVGLGPDAVLLGMADLIAPESATHDDADARHAALGVLNKMLDQAATEEELALLFESKASAAGVRDLFEQFLVEFIYGKMLRMLGEGLERSPVDTVTKRVRSKEILDYVSSGVKLQMALFPDVATFDFDGERGRALVDSVFQSAYEVFIG